MNYDLKTNIAGYSNFVYYRDHALWYQTETGLLFPVPISDAMGAQFRAEEKSLTLMRWIRRYLAELNTVAA